MDNRVKEPSVAIIGCGWLGLPLAKQLISDNLSVVVTCQSNEKVKDLKDNQVDAFKLILPLKEGEEVESAIFNQSTLVIAITPQMRQGKTDYAKKVTQLVAQAEQGSVESIILLSSTAVYNGLNNVVTEESSLDMQASKVALLVAAEKAVLAFSKRSIVLRLAGLVGPDRHPGKFFQNKRQLSAPLAPVNLVHQQDVINLIGCLNQNDTSGIYNVSSETMVSKKAFYQAAAKALNFSVPTFENEQEEQRKQKRISGHALRQKLNYQYLYNDLFHWLSNT